jgi:hypothetical protein
MMTNLLTKSDIRVLQFYRTFRRERFCCSIKTIADACGIGTKTVQRANNNFREMGILAWVSGNSASWRPDSRGQANKYRLVMSGIEGSAVTPAMTRRLYRLTQRQAPSQPNKPNRPSPPNHLIP